MQFVPKRNCSTDQVSHRRDERVCNAPFLLSSGAYVRSSLCWGASSAISACFCILYYLVAGMNDFPVVLCTYARRAHRSVQCRHIFSACASLSHTHIHTRRINVRRAAQAASTAFTTLNVHTVSYFVIKIILFFFFMFFVFIIRLVSTAFSIFIFIGFFLFLPFSPISLSLFLCAIFRYLIRSTKYIEIMLARFASWPNCADASKTTRCTNSH